MSRKCNYHKSLMADLLTPVSAYLRVSDGAGNAFLLESVEGGESIGRYSFIGVDPEKSFSGDFNQFRKSFPETVQQPSGLPPFTGGAVGFFSYDLVRDFESLDQGNKTGEAFHPQQPVSFDFYSTILAFDHVKGEIVIMSHESMEKVEEIEDKLLTGNNIQAARRPDKGDPISLSANIAESDYVEAVKKAQHYIQNGDIFQVVLSQRLEADCSVDPFQVYRALRYINPSPYLFFIKQGEVCVAGSSPEMLVKVQGKQLEYRPIAGTRPRGKDAEQEKELEIELINDEKEKAEHLMLVDLGRNDLGRVSNFGSVKVDKFMFLEKYSHVMHLVSKLKGELRDDLDCFDALQACFPAGTVTGAPKIRAMEIVDQLEPDLRGIYAGAIGYIDYSGNLDTCIAIRTIVMHKGKAYLQAGAGIVADSDPYKEHKECHNKAMALVQALELAQKF